MKLFKRFLTIVFLAALTLPCFELPAQDAEKEKIVQMIQDELKAFLEKDQPGWESHWVHGKYTKIVWASAASYGNLSGWDSIRASRVPYFNSGEKPTIHIEKSDFKIRVNGNTAVVYLNEKVTGGIFGPSVQDQTLILEKEGGAWKISEMFSFYSSSFETNDSNVEANLNDQGYKLLTMKKNAEALKVFRLNTELFPGAWNTWDSLAEGYMVMGDNKKAIEYYEKSLTLNPKNENAKKYLTKLKEQEK